MNISSKPIGWDFPPYVIAEIGVNHDGRIDYALKLVDSAADAGADAVKLQYFEAKRLLSKASRLANYQKSAGEKDPVEMLQRLEMPLEGMGRIIDAAHSRGLHAIVTIFSVELVAPARNLSWDAYKVGSPDIINFPLLTKLSTGNKPLILSTGAATYDEIAAAIKQFGDAVLHCVSAYPTPDENTHLAGIGALTKLCNNITTYQQLKTKIPVVGYSDHTRSIDTGALAVAAGAVLLEKHITYDRNAAGPDHSASLDKAMFRDYVQAAHRAWQMRGPDRIIVQPIEQDVLKTSRQSITTTRDLGAGHVITGDELTIKRPGTGISPALWDSLIGKTVACPIEADMPLRQEDLLS